MLKFHILFLISKVFKL